MTSALMSPILSHELAGPRRLVHRAAGCELHHERLDVEDGRAVDGVEAPYPQLEAVDVDELAPADANAVGAGLGPLGEDADRRPLGVPPRPPRPASHTLGVDEMEEVHDLEMGELVETQGGVGLAEPVVEDDRGFHVPPGVVDGLGAPTRDVADGLQRDVHELHLQHLHHAGVAVDLEQGTVGDAARGTGDADDGGDAEFAGDDDGVAHLGAHVDHDSLDGDEQRRPRRIGDGRHQDIARSQPARIQGIEHDPGPAPADARRALSNWNRAARPSRARPSATAFSRWATKRSSWRRGELSPVALRMHAMAASASSGLVPHVSDDPSHSFGPRQPYSSRKETKPSSNSADPAGRRDRSHMANEGAADSTSPMPARSLLGSEASPSFWSQIWASRPRAAVALNDTRMWRPKRWRNSDLKAKTLASSSSSDAGASGGVDSMNWVTRALSASNSGNALVPSVLNSVRATRSEAPRFLSPAWGA